MALYIVKRLLQAVPVLIGVSLVVFLLIKLVPGDVAASLLGPEATAQEIQQMRERLGLDEPLYVQYAKWLGNVLRGNLGRSIEMRVPVSEVVFVRLRNSLILVVTAMILSAIVGLLVGVMSAVKPRSIFDRVGMLFVLFGNSVPAFWFGLLLILVFSIQLKWLPVGGMYSVRGDRDIWDLARHLVLPAATLGILSMAIVARMTRSCMLDVLGQDYVRTATAKGLGYTRVVIAHGLRNALLPVVTVIGLQLGYNLGGAVLTETVFSWPGLGYQLFRAISTRDLPVIQGGILIIATGFVLINLIVDLLYAYLDPRVRVS